MSHHSSGATIAHTVGYWSQDVHYHEYDASQSDPTNAYYELDRTSWTQPNKHNGISFHSVTAGTEFRVNHNTSDAQQDNHNVPDYFTITPSGGTEGTTQHASALITSGDFIKLYRSSNNFLEGGFSVTAAMIFASSVPTVTEITINDPPTGPFNTGVGPDYYLDGEIVSDDTITASDITVYKDFQAYSNSNITMYGNHFSLAKSGDGLYLIECGGVHNVLYYHDDSWLGNITSSSSSRSTNVIRIRDVLAKIPSNIQGNHLELITDVGGPGSRPSSGTQDQIAAKWKTLGRHGFTKIDHRDSKVTWQKTFTNGSYWISNKYHMLVVFELGNISNEIKWRIKTYRWFDDLSLNHSQIDYMHESPWFEVGANSRALWWWTYDTNSTLDNEDGIPVSNHDSWLVDERQYWLFYDWIYYEEPEGDDEGPDGNPPNNVPPTDDLDPPIDNAPKNPYPGDKYPRRRRGHSFW